MADHVKQSFGAPHIPEDLVAAIQSDRIAAAKLGRDHLGWTERQVQVTLDGNGDEYPIVQGFAKYRLMLSGPPFA